MDTQKIIELWTEESGYSTTENLQECFYILADGSLLQCDGELYRGSFSRWTDHRELLQTIGNYFIDEKGCYNWDQFHRDTQALRYMSEANCLYATHEQIFTAEQQQVIDQNEIEIIRY